MQAIFELGGKTGQYGTKYAYGKAEGKGLKARFGLKKIMWHVIVG